MTDFNPDLDEVEDVAAMRREGDLGRFLRNQIRAGRARRSEPPRVVAPKPPGHRPGVWPSGTSPPGPVPQHTAAEWAAALADYRQWRNATNANNEPTEEDQ